MGNSSIKSSVTDHKPYSYIVVGGIGLVIIAFIVFIICCCCRKKRSPKLPVTSVRPQVGPYAAPMQYPQQYQLPTAPPMYPKYPYSESQLSSGPPSTGTSSTGQTRNTTSTTASSQSRWSSATPSTPLDISKGNVTFTYEQLEIATYRFAEHNLLGRGGFGSVYKGIIEGKEVAVKKLKTEKGEVDREFRAEVETISRVHHKNLVSLVGYCMSNDKRLLVYEFVPNKTLEFHLHGKGCPPLDWKRRWKIAVGSARGLAYLHEDCNPKIIHRDIKAANILLDLKFEPKVADFGLAKFQSGQETHVSTRIMGTFGYIAPEFVNSGWLTDKADVYSFGVVLLELITGRPPTWSNTHTLVAWSKPLLVRAIEKSNYNELIDPNLEDYNPQQMEKLIKCAASAIRQTADRRPTMSQIVQYLQGEVVFEKLDTFVSPNNIF